jgi:ABC-type multidrug transport system fused ATPase/permease subunit
VRTALRFAFARKDLWALALFCAAAVSGFRAALAFLARDGGGAVQRGDVHAALVAAGSALVAVAAQGLTRAARYTLTRRASLEAESALRERLLRHALHRDPAALRGDGVGLTLATLTGDVGAVRAFAGGVVAFVQGPLTLAAALCAGFAMSPRLTVAAVVTIPPCALAMRWLSRAVRRRAQRQRSAAATADAMLRDTLTRARSIHLGGEAELAVSAWAAADDAQRRDALAVARLQAIAPLLGEAGIAVGGALLLALAAQDVAAGRIGADAAIGFLVALALMLEPVRAMAAAAGQIAEAMAALARVEARLALPLPAADPVGAEPFVVGAVRVELRGVSASRGRGPILDRVDLRVGPGDLAVVTGPSGAGKSTLLDVVAGLLPPTDGVVTWNGRDAARWTRASRLSKLAAVDQDELVGIGTLRDALDRGGRRTDGQIRQALQAVAMPIDRSPLSRLPAGLDTLVGDGGAAFSGGEAQRLHLARALLADAPLWLLDEPTAHLDPAAEEAFLDALDAARPGRAVLLVTHRGAPLRRATAVYQLDGGRLILLPRGRRAAG